MPIFGSKFSPKKTPLRKSSSNISENVEPLFGAQRTIELNLGTNKLLFENSKWVPESGVNGSNHKINQKLKKKIQDLSEENNLLRLKYELMLNMLTQTTAESHIQEREIEKLKKGIIKGTS